MIPVLYSETETKYNNNGIGLLTETTRCEVTEVLNGNYTFELDYPIDGMWFKEIQKQRLIKAKPNDADEPHVFRISDITKSLDSGLVTVTGSSRTRDLGGNLINELAMTGTPEAIFNAMKTSAMVPIDYRFVSDITVSNSIEWFMRNPLNAFAGEEDSFIDNFRGEFKWGNDTIYFYSRRGTDKVTRLRVGKNIKGFKSKVSTAGLITRIMPYVKFSEQVEHTSGDKTTYETVERTIIGDVVTSDKVNNYPIQYIVPIDCSQYSTDITTKERLNEIAATYFTSRNPGCDEPKVSLDINILELADSEGYRDRFAKLETIKLSDTVMVYIPKFDVDIEVKVNSIQYDTLREKVISFQAGDKPISNNQLAQKQYNNTLNTFIKDSQKALENFVIQSANGMTDTWYSDTEPENPRKNDKWFKRGPEGQIDFYIFDGEYWQPVLTKEILDAIEAIAKDADLATKEQQEIIDNILNELIHVDGKFDSMNNLIAGTVQSFDSKLDVEKSRIDSAIDTANDSVSKFQELSADLGDITDELSGVKQSYTDQDGRINTITNTVIGMNQTISDQTGAINSVTNTVNGMQQVVSNKADKSTVTTLASQWTQTTELANGHTGQISNLGEQLNLRVTLDQVSEAILQDKAIVDTRGSDYTPSFYWQNYPKQTTVEFKNVSDMYLQDLATGNYTVVTTEIPWSDPTGGPIKQTARCDNGVFECHSINENEWSDWVKVVNSSNIVTQLNLSDEGVLIQGKYITLDGTSYITDGVIKTAHIGDAQITSAKISNIDAGKITTGILDANVVQIINLVVTGEMIAINSISGDRITSISGNKITTGQIDASLVNIFNLNASNITAGTLNAANVNIINLDASKIVAATLSALTANTGNLNVTGNLTMVTPNNLITGTFDYGDPVGGAHNPRYFKNGYMAIGQQNIAYTANIHELTSTGTAGAFKYYGDSYFGPDTLKLRNYTSKGSAIQATTSIYAGLMVLANDFEGTNNGITLNGVTGRIWSHGAVTCSTIEPNIFTGSFQINSGYTNNIAKLHLAAGATGASFNWGNRQGYADFFAGKDNTAVIWSNNVYPRTYSQSANMVINTDGSFGRATSASKYKLNISEIENVEDLSYNLLTINPKRWNDKKETEELVNELNGDKQVRDTLYLRQYHGLIAEDLRAAGLDSYISYNAITGEIEGIEYDKLWTLLIPIIRQHHEDILELKRGVA